MSLTNILEIPIFLNQVIDQNKNEQINHALIKKNSLLIKVTKELNFLKELLKSKNIKIPDEDKLFNSTEIYGILRKNTKLSNNSINSSTRLFHKYILFYIEKIKGLVKKAIPLNNDFIMISILEPKIIIDFLNSQPYSGSTKGNRYNNLIRILKIIYNEEHVNMTQKIFIEKKSKKIVIVNKSELLIILNSLFKTKNLNLIIIWYFCYNLGLSIFDVSNLIMNNYHKKLGKLIFFRNNKTIRRNINSKICEIIDFIKAQNNINENDYLIICKDEPSYLKNRIDIIQFYLLDWVKQIEIIHQETKKNIIKLFDIQRESIKITKIEQDIYNNFNLEFFKTEKMKSTNSYMKDVFEINKQIDIDYTSSYDEQLDDNFLNAFQNINKYNRFYLSDLQEKYKINDINFGSIIKEEYDSGNIITNINENYISKILNLKGITFNDDNNISENDYISNNIDKFYPYIERINSSIYDEYNNLKLSTNKNIYPFLEVKKFGKNDEYGIYVTKDLPANKILFEVSGSILTYNQLISKVSNILNHNFCYFEIVKNNNKDSSLFILISEFGNISYFIKKGNPLNENVKIKAYYNPKEHKIFSLALSKRKINKNEILCCINKFISLN